VYTKGDSMATFSVHIPQDLKTKLDKHPEINWSAYVKERFLVRIKQLRKFEELESKGEL
jgi:hypothetical protein